MAPVQVTCPACRTALRLPASSPTGKVRCPKCKETFAPIIEVEAVSESMAVVLDAPKVAAPPSDPDNSFFEWLADAKDPLGKKPISEPKPQFVEVEPEAAEPSKPSKRPRQERLRKEDDEPERARSGNGVVIAIVSVIAILFLAGLVGAGYLAYTFWSGEKDDTADAAPTIDDKGKPEPAAGSSMPDATRAKLKAATVLVRTQYPDGQSSTTSGFFVPGPALVITNARSVGQGRKPVAVSKIHVVVGGSTGRTLTARILGSDADLDLALLQLSSLELPEPLALGADTFAVKEPLPVVVFGVPSDGDAKTVSATNASISGTRNVAGTRPWFVLGGRVPQGSWGGPVTDASGRVIGVAGVVPGSDTVAAVPIETVQAFLQSAMKSAETNGPIAFAPPSSTEPKKQPRDDFDDPQFPAFPMPGRMPQPVFPPGFNPPAFPMFPQPGLPPNFPQPIVPPGFGLPPDMRRPGRGLPKITFPMVVPSDIKPAPLEQDRVEMKLPGKVADTCVGGGGRFWFLSIPSEKQIAVFDTASAKLVKNLPVGDNVKFAAGMNELFVTEGEDRLVRFDLKTFEKEAAVKLPLEGIIRQLAMGSASGGPLFVSYRRDNGRLQAAAYAILDASTLKELEPGPTNGNPPMGFHRETMQFRASPDGRTIASFGGGEHFWHVYSLTENGATIQPIHEPGVIVSPSDDGNILASTGVYSPEVRIVGRKDPFPTLRIPAQQGPFFLTIGTERNADNPFLNPNRVEGPQKIALHLPGHEQARLALADPGVVVPVSFDGAGVPGLQADRRVFFSPAAQLVGIVAEDKIVLLRFNPEAAVEKAGVDYLYVTSKPPLAVRGDTYKYPMTVKSKRGGVKVRIDSGPPGLRAEGTTLVWDVPQRGPILPDRIVATITDAGDRETTHSFTLMVKE